MPTEPTDPRLGEFTDEECAVVTKLVSGNADAWDTSGRLPDPVLRELGERGLLCAQVEQRYGGLGLSSLANGEVTAHTGSLCSSLRSVMTSQGMAAWAIQRLGTVRQRRTFLPLLTSGSLAAVSLSEEGAGSDLSAIGTEIRADGEDGIVVNGRKVWVTASSYADLIVVVGRFEGQAGAVVVPTDAPGVRIERVPEPVGCRAAGHSGIELDEVRLPKENLLGGGGMSLPMLVTTTLAYGRMSIAWGCAGILRACRQAAVAHSRSREQFGKPLHEHQLVARHLAELLVAERLTAQSCEHASRHWDAGTPEVVMTSVLAKHVGAGQAAGGASAAMQVLASSGARDGNVVARAYRDAKMMQLIEGTDEICQLLLAEHAVSAA